MSIFMKFKCWGCGTIPCTCIKVEPKVELGESVKEAEVESTTKPKLKVGDIVTQDGSDWLIQEIQDDIVIGELVTSSATPELRRIHEPYKILGHAVKINRR